MPVSGFKPGDRVLTPSGNPATVTSVNRDGGERVTVEMNPGVRTTFDARALRLTRRGAG